LDVRTNTLSTILWLTCKKCLDVRTNTLSTILWLASIKCLDVRTSTILWLACIKMFGRSNKYSLYFPRTDLYKNDRTFEQMFRVLSYDWPVYKCSDVRTNILCTILGQTCIKMFGRSNKYSLYYPRTDLYKNDRTFEQMFRVLSYDWPV